MHRTPQAPNAQSTGTRGSREDEDSARWPLRGQKILVVEDDPFIAMHLESILNAAGASVLGPAHDLSGALSLLETSKICAAVLDYRLQAGTTRLLARVLAGRGIPFLFQTSDPASAKREHPATPVIAKPFPADRLISLRTMRHDHPILGGDDVKTLGGVLPDTQFKGVHMVDRAGHWAYEEQPEQVSELLIRFLREHG